MKKNYQACKYARKYNPLLGGELTNGNRTRNVRDDGIF